MQPIFTKGKPCLNDMNPSLAVRGIAFAFTLIFTLATAVATHAQTPPPLPIVTITTDTPMVAEPQSMYFTLRADPAPSSDLAIEVYIHQPNRPDVAPYFSHFTIQAGESESDHHLTTQDTNAINEDYEIIVKPNPSYGIGAADRVQFNVTDSRRYQIDVYAAHSAISEGETAEFIVTIAPPPEEDQIIAAVLNFANSTTTSYSETFAIPINQGETEARYTVPTEDDAEAGNSYYMILAVSPDQNQLADPVEWVYVNVFDDDQPTIAISDVPEVYEGEDMVFTIRLVPPATTPVSVDYATQDYTAKAGFDYFSSEGTVTFAPGESEKQIRVTTIDDNLAETLVENFSFSLSNATGARIAFPQISDCQACQGVIRDDDGQREISVTTTTPEVRSGEDMHFRFQVNAATGYDTSFPYFLMKYLDDEVVEVRQNYTSLPQGRRFVDVTLKANREGADNTTSRVRYVMHAEDSHVLMIVSANTTASVNVLPAPPPDTPIDKVLPLVTLSTNAITINNTSVVNEPDPIYVTINADPPPTDDLAVLVRTHEFDGVRYVSDRGAHFYTIPAGQQSTTFLISTSDIASDYDDRFVFSLLPSPNDDYRLGSQPPLEVLIDDQQNYAYFITMTPLEEYVTEGDNAHYVLHATPTPSQDLTIHYKYDFSYAKNPASIFGYNGYATILAGENTTSFTILAPDDNLTHATTNLEQIIELYLPLSDDYESESDYVYTMVLDDDGGAVISQTLLAETSEGDNLSIEVFLSQALNTTASVDYEVISKHKTAEAGVDYIPQNGTLTFAPGETKHMVSIQTIDNDIVDFKRIVQLKLSNPEGAILQHQDTQHFINDDDEAVMTIKTIANDPRSDTIGFQLTSSHAFQNFQGVHYYVIADDATQPMDVYEFILPANTTSLNLTLHKGDGHHEMPANRTYTLYLRADKHYSLGSPSTAQFSTVGLPVVTVEAGPSPIQEPTRAEFYLLADPPPKDHLAVKTVVATPDDSNSAPYTIHHRLWAGEARQRINVQTYSRSHEDGRLVMELQPTNATSDYVLGDVRRAEILVKDVDKEAYQLDFHPERSAVLEGEEVRFTAQVTPAARRNLTIVYLTGVRFSHGHSGIDSGRVNIAAGDTTAIITRPSFDDNKTSGGNSNLAQASRYVYVYGYIEGNYFPPQGASVRVIEDDAGAAFFLEDYVYIPEGASQNISVHLSAPLNQSVAVNYATRNGTAQPGTNYIASNGTLVFAPGEVKKSFPVTTIGNDRVDVYFNNHRYFDVVLTNPPPRDNYTTANISRGEGRFFIVDDAKIAAYLEAIPRQHPADNYSFRVSLTNPVYKKTKLHYVVHGAGQISPVIQKTTTIPADNLSTIITIPSDILATDNNYTLALERSYVYDLATPSRLPIATTPLPVVSLMADMEAAANGANATAHFTVSALPPPDTDLAIGMRFAGDSLNNTAADLPETIGPQTIGPQTIGIARGQTEAEFSMAMTAGANITTLVAELLPGAGYWLGNATVSLQLAAAQDEGAGGENLLQRANRIILPKIALVFADSVAGAIRGRITSAFDNWGRATPTRVQVEGQTVRQFAERQAQQQAARNPWDVPNVQGANPFDPTQLNFATPIDAGGDSGNGGAGLWGEGFSRSLAVNAGDFSSDGDVRGGVLGLDLVADENLIIGLGVGHGRADFSFGDATQPDTRGSHTTDAVTLHPYFGWQNQAGTRLWGNAGFGEGDVVAVISEAGDSSNPPQTDSYTSVFDMRSLGLGGSVAIGDQSRRGDGDTGAMQFNLIGEGVVAEVKDATWRDWVRHGLVRLGIEWRQSATDDKGNIGTSGLQIAARHDFADGDAGDAGEDSTGVEFTGDVEKHMPEFGLTLDLQARVFVTDDSNYDEWGVAGGISWSASPPKQHGQPNPPHRQGLSLALRPQWGDTKSQSDTLLQHGSGALGSHATGKPAGYDYDVRYGVPILGGKHALTHFARGNDRDQTTIGSEVSIGRLRAVLEQEARGNHAFIRYEGKF